MHHPSQVVLRPAQTDDAPVIWEILMHAIERRRQEGSTQWQNGYPNPETIASDREKGAGFVLTGAQGIIAYCALLINDEPAYNNIEGAWLSYSDFVVVHRVAVAPEFLGKGWIQVLFRCIEDFALARNICSIKVDTNFDNPAMLAILEKLGYTYCGQVSMMGSPRMAFEKQLTSPAV
jgi:predicted GNAT superfamily acetyltransferase